MIDSLIRALARSGAGLTAEEVADVLALVAAGVEPAAAGSTPPLGPAARGAGPDREKEPAGALPPLSAAAGDAIGGDPLLARDSRYPGTGGVPVRLPAAGDAGGAPASAVALPSAAPLPRSLEFARSVRPFKRVRAYTSRQVLDIEATVEATAQARQLVIVSAPQQTQALDVAVVGDTSPSMVVWEGAVRDLAGLLGRSGAFRTVTRWDLILRGDGPPDRRVLLRDAAGTEHASERLVDPAGNRLVLVVSDAVSDEWYDRPVWDVLNRWAQAMPAALIAVLPSRYWRDTALGEPALACAAARPADPNSRLRTLPGWPADGGETSPRAGRGDRIPLPVVAMSPDQMTAWADAVVTGTATVDGILIAPPATARASRANAGLTPADRVRAFLVRASPGAQRLAAVLAGAPVLSLPLMRILQARLASETGITELAEIFTGGLLERSPRSVPGGQPLYQYRPGVRDRLARGMTVLEQWDLHDAVSEYLAARTGVTGDTLVALVADPAGPLRLDPGLDPFAALLDDVAGVLGIGAGKQDAPAAPPDVPAPGAAGPSLASGATAEPGGTPTGAGPPPVTPRPEHRPSARSGNRGPVLFPAPPPSGARGSGGKRGLLLQAVDFAGPWRWHWALTDEATGALLADHAVELDPDDSDVARFADLWTYTRAYAAPDRRASDGARFVADAGAWAARVLLGESVGAAIAAEAPVTVRVPALEPLLMWPLELAHANGRPLAARGDVSFVYDIVTASPVPAAVRVPDALRVLAVFSQPAGTTVTALRQERYALSRLIRRMAARGQASVQLQVLQYGVTRERLAQIADSGDGWDILHLAGPSGGGVFSLERSDGSPDPVSAADMVRLLRPLRRRVRLAIISGSESVTGATGTTYRLLGPHRPGRGPRASRAGRRTGRWPHLRPGQRRGDGARLPRGGHALPRVRRVRHHVRRRLLPAPAGTRPAGRCRRGQGRRRGECRTAERTDRAGHPRADRRRRRRPYAPGAEREKAAVPAVG